MKNDLTKELGMNFIEYAVAVNTDRAIPDAKSGLKPVAKRIIYGAYDNGNSSAKSHVKCADIVGNVMAKWHPHGDSSIYGALVRLAQPWVMRYPLIDFHGSKGNRDGDGPAAYRYTEARLDKLAEDGMLCGIKKDNVDYMPNYSETADEPITLPSLFPNLLCNPNTGIGVAMACNWLPHNLTEVANAIYDYIEGKEPTLPGPDFPTGGLIINKNNIPSIMKSGKGSIKIRGKYNIEDNNIVFYEIPYGIATEDLMNEIGSVCDDGTINGVKNIRNESNRKGFRLVIECEKGASIATIINLLFKHTKLQTSISYNQVALIDKTPTELNLKKCIEIYVNHNIDCITRECKFDINKLNDRLEIIEGLLKALENIDNVIELIKKSESAAAAKENLKTKYMLSEPQAKAIVDMKLGKLAGLERIELQNEKTEKENEVKKLQVILANPTQELITRLKTLVAKYGDARRTELTQISEDTKEDEAKYIEPEKCVVVMTEGGSIKRIPQTSFRTQRRNTKGVKTQDDITSCVIRTNTVDQLMIFTNQGNMYRLLVDNIPVGTNVSKGTPIVSLVEMEEGEKPVTIYSIYRDTDAKYLMFVTKNGLCKKTSLEEYTKTKKKTGISAINIKEGDELANVFLIKDENVIITTQQGYVIRFDSMEIGATSRTTSGIKGITLREGDIVSAAMPLRDTTDDLAVVLSSGMGKKIKLSEIPTQKRAGKGLQAVKLPDDTVTLAAAALISPEDTVLIVGNLTSVCISAADIPSLSRASLGNQLIKGNIVKSISKV